VNKFSTGWHWRRLGPRFGGTKSAH